jgi:hypothetical protein
MTNDKGQVTRNELPLTFWRAIGIVWASPNSLLGLTVGLLGLATGGRARRIGPTIEFHGRAIRWLLSHLLVRASAMTLGHVILGQDAGCLERSRLHEWVHVRQYERWGPFFIPAYLGCSLWLWLGKRDFYRDNPFEVEAYTADASRRQPPQSK